MLKNNIIASLSTIMLSCATLVSIPSLAAPEVVKSSSPWPINVPQISDKFDWLLLKTGELLGGDLVSMYDHKVEFDSDEVGVISIDMKDIAQIRTRTIMSIRQDNDEIHEGQLIVNKDSFSFVENPEVSYPRSTLLAIATSEKSGESLWSGEISLGADFKKGNSASFDYTGKLSLRRLSSSHRVLIDYLGVFSEVEDQSTNDNIKTEENHRLTAYIDWFYKHNIFFRLPSFEYYTDEFKNIDHQIDIGVAAGYVILDDPLQRWDVFAGPSGQYTKFVEAEEDEATDETSPLFLIGTSYERDITDNIEFEFDYNVKFTREESGSIIQHLESSIEIELINDFDIELSIVWDRTEDPIPDENGFQADQTDLLFTVGLEYSF